MFCAIKMPRNLYGAKFFQSIYFLRFHEERWLGSLKNRKMIADLHQKCYRRGIAGNTSRSG